MKIERVNENQIRCILSKEDLAVRQIKLSELAYGSEKAKRLFRDMIEQANNEFGFEVDDIPLMIEAIPLTGENIILQITKVEYPEELDTRFSKFSASDDKEESQESSASEMFSDMQGADDILDIFQKMKEDLEKQVEEKEKYPEDLCTDNKISEKSEVQKFLKKKLVSEKLTKIYEFKEIDEIVRLGNVLGGYYRGENDLYKDEKKQRFYLFIRKSVHSPEEFNKVCNIISEYALCKKYTSATEAFFKEHGKLILRGNAIQILGEI